MRPRPSDAGLPRTCPGRARAARRCLVLGLVWLLAACWGAPAAALDLDPRPERAPVRLPGGLFGRNTPVDGLLRVKLFTKKVKYSRILETEPLAWTPAGEGGGLALIDAAGRRGLAFGRFNEVALDLRDADPDNPALAALFVRTPDGRTFVSDPLACVRRLGPAYRELLAAPGVSVPVARAAWADKTPLYLARRLLDLPFDEVWRVAEDGPSTFVQRRFDRDLLAIGAVDLVMRRPVPVQVNIVAALDPAHPRQRTVLDWYALGKQVFELPDGRSVLRVYVGRALRAAYPGLRAARLKEISLMFFRQPEAEVRRDKVVERLAFISSGIDPAVVAAGGLPGRLPTRVREPFAGTKRLFVNVGPAAAALGTAPGATAEAAVRLPSMVAGRPGGASLESAVLARVSPRRDTPAFLAAADELARSLGAAPDIDRPDGGVTVTPLWSLAPPLVSGSVRGGPGDDPAALTPVYLSGGQGLFTAKGGVRLYRAPAGLVVEGRAEALRLAVDAAFRPAADTDYFFRLDIGAAPGLAAVDLLVAPAGGGPAKTYALRPGAPTPLPDLPAAVAGATVRFAFTGREFSLPLTRAMLVAVPRGQPHVGLYEARLPWPVSAGARPETAGLGPGGAARFVPKASLGRFSWLTADYALVGDPVAVSVAGGAPARPDTRSGLVAGRLPDEKGGAAPEPGGANLDVTGPEGRAGGRLELTHPVFSGDVSASWRDFFAVAPLAALDGTRFAPGEVSGETARRIHTADDWLDLGPARLPAAAAATAADRASARFFAHPWYGVSALCFETDRGLDLAGFARPRRGGGGAGGPGTLGRALWAVGLCLVAGLGLWLVGRERLRALAARPARWLLDFPTAPGAARSQSAWSLGACGCLAAASFVLPPFGGRVALGLAAAALLPLWRVLAPRVTARTAARLPGVHAWLAADPGRVYFLGFALSLLLAAGLRIAGLDRLTEFLVRAGLYCLLAGLYLEVAPGRDGSPAGFPPTPNPGDAP